jgi:lathosterol oxidase
LSPSYFSVILRMPFLHHYINHFILIASRYFIVATLAWLLWYKLFNGEVYYKKIQLKLPANEDYQREISYSIGTMLIFSVVPLLILNTSFIKFTQFYTDIYQHSLLWFWVAFPIMFVVHDTYFYWTHRLIHHPRLFPYFHLVHHKSINPSPWAAYSFHPLEAIVESGVFLLLVIILPLTKIHLLIFFSIMILYNVYGHLGWELYPKKFSSSKIGKWINTSVNHNLHHQYFKGNYSLYFLWWDRWMGTLREDYDTKYDDVKNRTNKLSAV